MKHVFRVTTALLFTLLALAPATARADARDDIQRALRNRDYETAGQRLVEHGQLLSPAEIAALVGQVTWQTRISRVRGVCATGKGFLLAAAAGTATLLVCTVVSYVLPVGLLTGALTGAVGFYVGNRYGGPGVSRAFAEWHALRGCKERLAQLQRPE